MSLRTNVCPVDVSERAPVRCWTAAERKMRDMKESIIGCGRGAGGEWMGDISEEEGGGEGEEEEEEEEEEDGEEDMLLQLITQTFVHIGDGIVGFSGTGLAVLGLMQGLAPVNLRV